MFNRRFTFRKTKSSENALRDDDTRVFTTDTLDQSSEGRLSSREGSIASIREQSQHESPRIFSPRPRNKARKSDTAVRDPLGLNVVHRPHGDREFDIVFFHGLGGTSRLTWSKNKDLDLFWPHKFLPMEPDIDHARILTFGYDASFRPGSSKNATTVLDFAKDLLFELKYAKDELDNGLSDLHMGRTPIIFVVHSMGGLIVKEAYMQGRYDPDYETIVGSISAIIFLSTPHRGTNLAETLNRILQVSFVSAPKQFISELTKNSYTLQKLNEQFRHVASKLDIISFYETRKTAVGFNKNSVMVLEKDSSVLGYPGEISKPLDADHHGVCKYESRQDPLYINVRNVLKSLMSKFRPSSTLGSSQEPPSVDRRGSEIAAFLSVYEPPDNDFTFFRDRWSSGTCGWILHQSAFTNWLEDLDSKPRLLWIHGRAASGKSVLSSFIIDHLSRNGKQCQYFFIRFGDQHKRSVHTLLRSIAYQISRAVPDYNAKLAKLASDAIDLKTADVRNIWQWLFRSGICTMHLQTPLYWVLDGVDESDSPQTMIKLLSDLSFYSIPIRLLLVSRKTQELSSAFQRLSKKLQMDSIRTEGNVEDFRRFIEQEMDDVAGNESYTSRITSLILERAQGNFLWLHLAVQRINKCISQKDVEDAIQELPPGMEALYDRMASAIAENPNDKSRKLAHDIVAWTTCARRLMTINELSEALGQDAPLDLQRSIGELCGGFVVVDIEGKIAMIHQTAREYLFSDLNRSFNIERQLANELLFQRCLHCLMDSGVRFKINRNQGPELFDYAMSSWFVHLCLADPSSSDVMSIVIGFLQAPDILTWIHGVAKSGKLHLLVLASQYLTNFSTKQKDIDRYTTPTSQKTQEWDILDRWATDLVKIVGKFGRNIGTHPQAIYKLIPPFCPHESIIYQQFGKSQARALSVSGFVNQCWDDCLGRISLEQGTFTSTILTAGNRIAILSLAGRTSKISIIHASTFEEMRQIIHSERVLKMHLNSSGTILATYGYLTTKIWDLSSGECIKSVENPTGRPWPHTFLFVDEGRTLLVGCDDRRLRSLELDVISSDWDLVADFDEQQHEGTFVNSPTCMAISPEGDQMAFGYRGHPVTLWEVDGPTPIARCTRDLASSFSTTAEQAWGEVVQLVWHPFSGEVLGLYLEGTLFKWQPFDDEVKEVMTGANKMALNRDGSLCATGDANGAIKIYNTANFSLLYQLSSEDPILGLSFSTDSKRLYDIRGTYANMWEPNTLVRLADSSELLERNSDSASISESLVKVSTKPEYWYGKVDCVTAIGAQRAGPLYCYGTEEGVVNLCAVGQGRICELRRSKSYMSIEHITWSEDGRLVAFADVSGKLVITGITKSEGEAESWNTTQMVDTLIAPECGGIKQLIFHPRGDRVLVYTTTKLCTVGLGSSGSNEVLINNTTPTMKWMCHPSSPEHILGFEPDSLHVFSWDSLEEQYIIPFDLSHPNAAISPTSHSDAWGLRETSVTPILTADSTQILTQISRPLSAARQELQHLLLSVDAIHAACNVQSDEHQDTTHEQSKPTIIPLDMDNRVRVPLSFLPRGRLIFLDEDYSLCTWRLRTGAHVGRRQSSASTASNGLVDFKRHYLLPADWISSENAALCCMMFDGTLLFPRNGELAVVQSESLRPGNI